MKTLIKSLVIILSLVMSITGCINVRVEDLSINELRYINDTGHSMHLKMSWYEPSDNWSEHEFYSVDIPSGSLSWVDFALEDYHGSYFSSCSITFDDGKRLNYHVDVPEDYEFGRISTDPSSPLSPSAYSVEVNNGLVIRSFIFNEEHYLLAE